MKFTFQPESRPLDGYTLKRGIARGGFGEVYYALSDAGKEVAVKLLQHNLDIELRGVQQCLNLRHPNLVTIFDVKSDSDGDHWVVMEYIGGQTLEQILQARPGPMPLDQIERWLSGLAGGLTYLHERGIVHRDVKPGNIFWDQGAIKLGDIGLSKFMSPSRRSAHTESVGTVYYMAPEVTYGKYGYEVDVYSVGVMLFEMLTGQLPFDGQSTGEILMKHLSEPPDLKLVPAQFRPVVSAALEKDPKRRTGSMAKLLEDFHHVQRSGPVPVPVSSPRPSAFASPPPLPLASEGYVTNPWVEERPQTVGEGGRSTGAVAAVAVPVNAWLPAQGWPQTRGGFIAIISVCVAMCMNPVLGLLLLGVCFVISTYVRPDSIPVAWLAWLREEMVKRPTPVTLDRPVPPAPPPVKAQVVSVNRAQSFVAAAPWGHARRIIPPKGIHQRVTELMTSLSWAMVLALVFGAGTGFLSPLFGNAGSPQPDLGKLGLFTITTLLGAWAVLIVSKLQEGRDLSNGYRRLTGLVAGAAVGSAAWWLSQALLVDLSVRNLQREAMFSALGRQPLVLEGEPTWLAFTVFFGLLFGLRRWWWHADANRPALFRVSSVVLTVGLGAFLPFVFIFPWDWAVTWAAVTSCVVQLSAVWIPTELRGRAV